jgi:sterol desaturase/sphingolipid hydroxylase (fatty acid hydroxylase superfamily)
MSLYDVIDSVHDMPLLEAALLVMLANVAMFLAALAAGAVLTRCFSAHRIAAEPPPIDGKERALAAACVFFNGLIAVAGVMLWREGWINLRPYGDYTALLVLFDAIALFLAMDVLMYLFHRIAHQPLLFPLAHVTHHRYDNPKPLTLFVLSPVEVIGFGVLWLLVLVIYTASIEGILIYLSFNLAFGLVAHLGVEPAPRGWLRLPLLRYVSTSTFHAEHHFDREHNYGFYLVIWDRLFGTLSPDYRRDFDRAATGAIAVREPLTGA